MVPVPPAVYPSYPALSAAGVHVHAFRLGDGFPLVSERDLDLIQAAGFRKVRLDLLWQEVEKRRGVYDFRKYDALIDGLMRRGIQPMVILGLGNRLYAKGLTIQPCSTREAFERYAMTAVQRYQGRGIIWELVNEPNHEAFWEPRPDVNEYMALARNLLPRLKALDPTGFFAAPSTAGAPPDFLEACFRQGLLALVDGVTIHPHQAFAGDAAPANRMPEHFEMAYRRTRHLIDRYAPRGKHVPILLGEWGYSTARGELDEQTQADYLVRQMLLGAMVGTPVNVWYNWKGDILGGNRPLEKEENFGIVRPALQPKPAWYAMRELARNLGGLSFVRRLPSDPQDYLLLFSDGYRSVTACWTIIAPHSVAIDDGVFMLSGKPVYQPVVSKTRMAWPRFAGSGM